MMELRCAFLLISASLVLATPHGYGGYGVKGGASARAESSASAGAFAPIPVAVPLGAGYSGSFSKSSSSSSASSSASSSSSSSSFSYGGSGAGGFGLNGGAPGHGGCSTGSCQNAGGNGIPTPHGASGQGYNSANAAASAQAGAVSGLGCQGPSCDGNSEKCTSGSCKTGTGAIDSDSNKCASGQCGSDSNNGASLTDDGANDIRAVTDSAHNANHQSGIDKAHNGADSNCFNGKCGPSSSKPNHYGHESGDSYHDSSASNNQQGSGSSIGLTSHYQKPSTHLETPKESSKCSSGKCNAGLGEPGHGSLPSSYNVPIHGAYDKGEPKPSCDGVKCENQPKSPYTPTDNSVTKGPSPFDYPSSTNCVGSSCFGTPGNQVTGGPSGTVRPGNNNFGHSPSHVPSNLAPAHIGKPSDANAKLPNDKLPPYTGGFGGPAGILNPNDVPVLAKPTQPHGTAPQNGQPLGSTPTGCNSPSCSGHPSATGPAGGLAPTGTYNHRPGGDIPSDKLPTYTGGFGGPAGFDVHATVTNKPSYAHPGSPSYTTQPSGNIGTPGCKVGENCGGYSPTAGATSGATAPSGHYGTTKPSNGINSPNDKLPTYTGGFGGPGGVFSPDQHGIHATGPSSPGYTPSGTYNSPSGQPGGCKTPNCYPSFGSTAATESFGISKPGSSPYLSSVTLPAYTSSYGPSGAHRPNEISGPASPPSFTHTQSPSSPGSYSPDCKTGNCGKYPTSGPSAAAPNQPQYSGGFGGPSGTFKPDEHNSPGCKSGNCGSYPISGPSAGTNAQPGSFGVTKPNTDVTPNQPQNTGGFGGPSGTFRPDEHNSPGCKSGNCGSYPISGPSAGANAQPGSFGVTKPNTDAAPNQPQYTGGFGGPSGTFRPDEHNSPGCKSGNCGSYPISGPSVGANAQPGSFGVTKPNVGVNTAAPHQPHYTTGFGGPSDTLKPSEHDSPGCKSGNCGSYPISGPSAGSNAQPGSFGVTKPNTDAAPNQPQYTGGFGGPSGTFKPEEHNSPGCKSGNCGSYPTSGPSAGANAQPGSFGVTKPNAGVNIVAPHQTHYTGGLGGSSGTTKPSEHGYVTPSTGSTTTNCGTPNCGSSPTANVHASSGANVQIGSYGATKPSGANNPSDEKPTYNGGFGGAAGLLKPNEFTVPAVSPTPLNKPTGVSTPATCISGNCNPQAPHSSIPHAHHGAASGAHATAAATAEANAVAYTGGFGGPPGLLTPFDDGKIGALPTNGGQSHGPQVGGAHGSLNANLHSQHGAIPGASGGPTGPAGAHGNAGAQAGSAAGAAAYAGAAAGASAGAHGYNPHGSYNHAGNVKGGSPCGGGCGGSGGAYNGGSTLDISGGHGFPKLLADGLNSAGSASAATAKSLSGANAFGLGGSFASSSASAHASSGAYTKGGYGKR